MTPKTSVRRGAGFITVVAYLLLRGVAGPAQELASGPVAAYSFDEGQGTTFADASNNNNSGTISGATWAAGRFGRALSFDGLSAIATVPSSASLNLGAKMSIEAWVYPAAPMNGWGTVVLKERVNHLSYALYGNTGPNTPSGEVVTDTADTEVHGTAQVAANTWTHLATTYDGATLRMYVNGAETGSRPATGAILSSTNPLRIGGNLVWGEYFNGLIDEVRVYNRAITAMEIQQDMTRRIAAPDVTPPTVTAVKPAAGATGVPTGTDVAATFSEAVDPQSVTTATVTLRDASNALVPATVSDTAGTRTANLYPNGRLAASATYTARVLGGTTGVRDVAGNPMSADMVWTFTTSADVSSPIVVVRSPGPGATAVATAVSPIATFNKAMNAGSIVFVLRDAAGAVVPSTVSYDAGTLAATLRPTAGLAALTSYTATVESAADSAGTPIAVASGWSFTTGSAGFQESTVFGGLTEPTAIEFAADGRVFVAEKSGLIKVFDSLTATVPTIFADLRTQVHNAWDRGLLGMALDPQFPSRPYVYVLYTHDAAIGGTAPRWGSPGVTSDPCPTPPGPTTKGCIVSGRLSRLQASGNIQVGPEQVLVEDWPQQFPSHSIGTVLFGPEGALYASGGEGADFNAVDYGQTGNPFGDPPVPVGGTQTPPTAEGGALRSQDLRTPGDPVGLSGTIIRVDPATGAGLADNPLSSSADANARRIIAYGLRNPFRFVARPGTRELYIGDVGWDRWEEIDRIDDTASRTVKNFGWPCYEGAGRHPAFEAANLNICTNLYNEVGAATAPFYSYAQGAHVVAGETCGTAGAAIAGLAFYGTGSYPARYQGALFFADYSRNCIWVMFPDAAGAPNPANIATFAPGAAGPVQLKIGPGGDLFYVDLNGGTIRRIQYYDGNRPPRAMMTATPSAGLVPLTVNFDGTASSDPDPGDSITFAWDLDGDGFFDNGTTPTVSYTYTKATVYTARLRVTDSHGLSDVRSQTITTNSNPPVATILTPASTLTWSVGDAIGFSGSATDKEDGVLPPSAFSWALLMHHCNMSGTCHVHPIQTFAGVSSGSFAAPDHEYPAYLELALTVTDSSGLTDTRSVRLDPKTTVLSFESAPAGLVLAVGSRTSITPFTRTVIAGSSSSVSAPSPQTFGGVSSEFVSWSDGGAATHTIVASSAPATYRATYAALPSAGTQGLVAAYGFNEGTGTTVADASPANNAGTISGATWVDGRAGRALSFNGTSSIVTVLDSSGLHLTDAMTLEAWVNPRTLGGWRTVVMKERPSHLSYALYGNTGANRPSTEVTTSTNTELQGTAQLPIGAWSHLAGTYDGAHLSLYVNGALVATSAVAGLMTTSTDPLRIGGNLVWGEYFDGIIDEVRIYNRALSQAEIQTDMNTAVGGGPIPDITPPVISNGAPAGTVAGTTTSTTLQVSTDKSATCRYSLTVGAAYAAMTTFATTGGTAHATPVSGLASGTTYRYYVRCSDAAGNVNTSDYLIAFTVTSALPPGLVAAYSFNDGTGTTAADASGTGNSGSVANGAWTATGKWGGGLVFNGTNSVVTIADAPSLRLTTGMTIEAWVLPAVDMGTAWASVILKETTNGLSYSLYANGASSRPSPYINTGGADVSAPGTAAVAAGTWTHLAATYDGATLRLYVNGALIRSTAVSGSLLASRGPLRIGGNAIWGEWFTGTVDEVRIYNRALTAAEIGSDMTQPLTP